MCVNLKRTFRIEVLCLYAERDAFGGGRCKDLKILKSWLEFPNEQIDSVDRAQ